MEKSRRATMTTTLERARHGNTNSGGGAAAAAAAAQGDKGIAKKKRTSVSLKKAAEQLQSRLLALASFGQMVMRGRNGKEESDEEGMASSPFLDALIRLPDELHMLILRELRVADLLALRRTARVLNLLVVGNAPALVRHCVRHRMGSLHLQLYPAPKPNAADFPFLLAMRRRHIASIRLTRQLADHLVGEPLQQSCPRQRHRQLWTSVYERMLPLVFGVGYFLEEHRRVLLERDLGRIRPRSHIGYDICTTEAITNEERKMMKKLDRSLRLQYFFMYCFVLQVLQRMLRPSQPVGKVGRMLRVRYGQAACAEDIAFLVILGGIGQMAKLFACPTYNERRRYLHAYITHMSPHTSKYWRRHWRNTGVLSPALLDDIPCARIGITKLDQVWAPLIAQMMGSGIREFTDQERIRYEELKASKKYINEVVGYDILQGRTADGSDFDEDHEYESVP